MSHSHIKICIKKFIHREKLKLRFQFLSQITEHRSNFVFLAHRMCVAKKLPTSTSIWPCFYHTNASACKCCSHIMTIFNILLVNNFRSNDDTKSWRKLHLNAVNRLMLKLFTTRSFDPLFQVFLVFK